jgi:hypothetical protein
MRWLAPVLVCACGFSRTGGTPDPGGDPDAPRPPIDAAIDAPPDAPPDTPPALPCRIGLTDATGTIRGRAGDDTGGGTATPLVCQKAGDRIVGFQLRLSDQDTVFGGRSAHAVSIACATVSIAPDGAGSFGAVTVHERTGLGGMGWTPSTQSTLTMCDPGSMVYGINVHTGGGANGRFLDVTLRCAKLGYDGKRTGQDADKTVEGSGDEADGSDTASCNATEVLATMPLRDGRGIDSVDMSCTVPRCE